MDSLPSNKRAVWVSVAEMLWTIGRFAESIDVTEDIRIQALSANDVIVAARVATLQVILALAIFE